MKTPKNQISLQEWHLFHRLEAAGCPVSHPCYPLQVAHEPSALGTDIFPLGTSTGLAIHVRLAAAAPFTIRRIDLESRWVHTATKMLDSCPTHPGCNWFHDCCGGDVHFRDYALIPLGLETHVAWKEGEERSRYLVACLPEVVPASAGAQLEATLLIHDAFGGSHPHSFMLDNSQRVTNTGDAYCHFSTAK